MQKYWYDNIQDTVEKAHASAEDLKLAIKQEEGQKYLFEAKRVSVSNHKLIHKLVRFVHIIIIPLIK